jgi:FixH protein
MKITWGHKLIFVFILFGTMMAYMVFRSFGTKVDLVSKEYYNDELAYQQLIDGATSVNTKGLPLKIVINGRTVTVSLPAELPSRPMTGTAWFYCVSDSEKDMKIPLMADVTKSGQLGRVQLQKGYYIAKVRWSGGQDSFYLEEKLNIR